MKYKAISTRFYRDTGKVVPEMNKSSVLNSKTALKSFVSDEIDTADDDADTINVQIIIRPVVEDEVL